MDGTSDEELMARVLKGDREALAALAERHHGPVLGYLYRLTGESQPLAQDLAQETFVTLLRGGGYHPGRPFKPWLYAIATNLARDHFKSARVRRVAPDGDAALDGLCDAAPGPEELALAAERGREVAAAVAALGEEYRVALVLRFYQGLSLREIAEALDIPLGTVKSRLSVGSRRLRELLCAEPEGANR